MLGLPGLAVLAVAWGAAYWFSRRLYTRGTWRRPAQRDVAAVGVLIAVTLGFYWPLFFTESWIPKGGGDLASFIYPTYAYGARWLKRGVVPLWNPHLYMGMPFAADNQSGLFYPVNLLFFVLTPELTYEVVELMAVSHVFLAGLFAYLLIRDLPSLQRSATGETRSRLELGKGSLQRSATGETVSRLELGKGSLSNGGTGAASGTLAVQGRGGEGRVSRVAALAGAVAYMLSDLFVTHPGNLNIVATAAWLPLALLCFRRALKQRRGWGWVAWSGIVLGVAALAGHAQLFLYVGMALGLYTLFEVYRCRGEGLRAGLSRALKLAVVGAIAFGLAALALIPAYDLTQYTVRAEMSYEQASDFAITVDPSASISAGVSTTFDVTFNPSAAGLRAATLEIENDDADEGLYDFAIQVTAVDSPGEIRGLKWDDLDGDGQRDAGEPGMDGVTIYLDLNENDVLDDGEPSTVTVVDNPATKGVDETGQLWICEKMIPKTSVHAINPPRTDSRSSG